MKQPVILSAFCNLISYGVLLLLAILMISTWDQPEKFWLFFSITLILLVCGMWWGPVSVSADNGSLRVRRVVGKHTVIPYSEIDSIEPFQPTMGTRRIFGGSGFMGYWGWYREYGADVYFAYYGKASDCFLVKLRNGRRYVIGCRNPHTIIDTVRAALPRYNYSYTTG